MTKCEGPRAASCATRAGCERGPSAQVVDALATVLRLDEDGRLHLFRLAN